MKISDSIKYSFLKTIRDKKNIYFIIIMTLCLFILIATLFFRIVYFALGDDAIEMDPASRLINVSVEDEYRYLEDKTIDFGYDKLLNLEHVVDTYRSNYASLVVGSNTFKDDKHEGIVTLLYGSEAAQPKYINGERIKDGDTGVAVCSRMFNPDYSGNKLRNEDIEFINGDDLIGTTFNIEKEKFTVIDKKRVSDGMYKKEYKIIGTFDASETRDELSSCYISKNDIIEIADVTDPNMGNDYGYYPQVVLIDKYKNINSTIKEIEKMGFQVSRYDLRDYEMLNLIKSICLLIISVIIIAIMFLSSLYVKKLNMKNKNELAIMKSYGYEKKDIMRFSLGSLSCLMTISFVTGIILFLITLVILKIVFHNFLLANHIYIGFFISPYLFALLILIIISLITNYFTINKLSKKQTLSVIKG